MLLYSTNLGTRKTSRSTIVKKYSNIMHYFCQMPKLTDIADGSTNCAGAFFLRFCTLDAVQRLAGSGWYFCGKKSKSTHERYPNLIQEWLNQPLRKESGLILPPDSFLWPKPNQSTPWKQFDSDSFLALGALKPGEDPFKHHVNQAVSDELEYHRKLPDPRHEL